MNFLKHAVQTELDNFFARLHGKAIPEQEVTRSAFSQARQKLNHEAFIELNEKVTALFYAEAPIQRWHGYRLVGCDGTTLRLPNTREIRKSFNAKEGEVPLARMVQLYDVLNHVAIATEVSACEIGEAFHAEYLHTRAQLGDLLLYDRGFPSFYLMALHRHSGVDYCMRTPVERFTVVADFVKSGQRECWSTLAPTSAAKKACRDNGLDDSPLRVRLIRVDLPNGDVEVLITSLGNAIPPDEFAELYHFRWYSEEGYKSQKCRVELENFTGKSVHSVYQDIFAKILSANLTAMVAFAADRQVKDATAHRKRRYAVNRTAALSKTKHHLVLFIAGVNQQVNKLIQWVASECEAIRPGRQFERKNPGSKKAGFHFAYKSTA